MGAILHCCLSPADYPARGTLSRYHAGELFVAAWDCVRVMRRLTILKSFTPPDPKNDWLTT